MEKTEFHVQRLLNETFGSSVVQHVMVGQGFPLSDTSFLILPKFNSWLTFFMLNACSGMRFQDSSKDKIRPLFPCFKHFFNQDSGSEFSQTVDIAVTLCACSVVVYFILLTVEVPRKSAPDQACSTPELIRTLPAVAVPCSPRISIILVREAAVCSIFNPA